MTQEAQDDFEEILLYTVGTWGEEQRRVYKAAIDRALRRLRQFSHLGRPRDDLFAGCRGLQVEHHVIFYRVDDAVIRVARILHERMDPTHRVKG